LAFICHGETFSHFGACAVISGRQCPDGDWEDDTSFMASMQRFEDGVVIPALHKTKRQYGSLLLVIADGKARAQLLETKKAVSSTTERICTHCNVTSSQRAHVYDFTSPSCPLLRTTSESHERDYELMQTSTGDAVAETFSKALGQSGKPHAFSRMSGQLFFLEGMPYDQNVEPACLEAS